jgi:hypothetical protein
MISPSDPPDLRTALFFHQAGRLDEAANIYRELLVHNPGNSNALHYLGLLEARTGSSQRHWWIRKRCNDNRNERAASVEAKRAANSSVTKTSSLQSLLPIQVTVPSGEDAVSE